LLLALGFGIRREIRLIPYLNIAELELTEEPIHDSRSFPFVRLVPVCHAG
jgi:hypothetical protein